jgi:hypothetical protein
MRLRTHLEFRSPKFAGYPGEEGEVNGKRLAEYLRDKMKAEAIQTGEIYSEDWGWAVPVAHPLVAVWIGCGRYREHPDGYLAFIEPSKATVRKNFLRRIDMLSTINQIADALEKVHP